MLVSSAACGIAGQPGVQGAYHRRPDNRLALKARREALRRSRQPSGLKVAAAAAGRPEAQADGPVEEGGSCQGPTCWTGCHLWEVNQEQGSRRMIRGPIGGRRRSSSERKEQEAEEADVEQGGADGAGDASEDRRNNGQGFCQGSRSLLNALDSVSSLLDYGETHRGREAERPVVVGRVVRVASRRARTKEGGGAGGEANPRCVLDAGIEPASPFFQSLVQRLRRPKRPVSRRRRRRPTLARRRLPLVQPRTSTTLTRSSHSLPPCPSHPVLRARSDRLCLTEITLATLGAA